MTIYDKPTRALLKDMLKDLGLKPGQVFTTTRWSCRRCGPTMS